MKKRWNCQGHEEGFVLVTALLIMLVLTLIGIAGNRNTSTELKIAGNDRIHKKTFYEADGGTELASEVLEQNIACLDFTVAGGILAGNISANNMYDIKVESGSLGFWRNFPSGGIPSDSLRDFHYPVSDAGPHTNVSIGGNTKLTTGAAIQMAAGYERLAKSIGSGGSALVYDVNVQHVGTNNSESIICIKYRHILGQEGDCHY